MAWVRLFRDGTVTNIDQLDSDSPYESVSMQEEIGELRDKVDRLTEENSILRAKLHQTRGHLRDAYLSAGDEQ